MPVNEREMQKINGAVETVLTDVRNAMKDMRAEARDAYLTSLIEALADMGRGT